MKTKKINENEAIVICGSCGKEQSVSANEITEPVDYFGEFIDIYFAKQEYDRLMKRATRLKEKNQYSELATVYSYLVDICRSNSKEAFKEYEKSKSEEDLDYSRKWEEQSENYRKMSKEIFEKLELKELEDGNDESIYEDIEDSQFHDGKTSSSKGVKRGRTLDEILDDKGFLEF